MIKAAAIIVLYGGVGAALGVAVLGLIALGVRLMLWALS